MVYDITDRKSFENLELWLKDVREFADQNVGIILAGNKADLADARAVSPEEGKVSVLNQLYLNFGKGLLREIGHNFPRDLR